MAHKKGVGSSRNGRESIANGLELNYSAANQLKQAISLFVREVQSIIPAIMLEWVKTIPSLLWLTAASFLKRKKTTSHTFM